MKNGINKSKSTDTVNRQSYSCGNKALHIAIVMFGNSEVIKQLKGE